MKFNCGPSKEAKDKKKLEELKQRADYLVQWREEFAWFPTRVGEHDCRWLETVEVRCTQVDVIDFCPFNDGPSLYIRGYEYRAKDSKENDCG